MTTTHRPGEVLVLGGGIGGLATALSIARGGGTVRVLEQAPEFGEIGAGLQVGANATRVLGALGVLDAVEALAVHPRQGVLLDARTGHQLTALTLGDTFRRRYGYPYIVVHRSDLLAILLDACRAEPGIALENGRAVVEVVNDPDGLTAVASCADGARYRADVIIGADGLRSRARRLLDTGEPVFSGYAAYRGTVPVGTVSASASADDVLIWIGPGRHLVQYPVRRGELYNQVAVFDVGSDDPADGTPDVLRSRFADSCPAVLDALELLNLDRSWPMYDREPMPTWVAGRVALLGDAAHPMLQYLAQGAGQALEDADQLARALAAHRDDPPAALKAYEERRLVRAGRCQRVARPWGRTWHTDDDVTAALRDRVLRGRAFDDYTEVDWLYADPYADVDAATSAA